MKRIVALCLLGLFAISTSTADERWHHDRNEHHDHPNWIASLLLGSVIGYELSTPRTVIVEAPVKTFPLVQLPPPPLGYHYESVLDATCNCYKTVLIPNQ